jgi:hypothetical protein
MVVAAFRNVPNYPQTLLIFLVLFVQFVAFFVLLKLPSPPPVPPRNPDVAMRPGDQIPPAGGVPGPKEMAGGQVPPVAPPVVAPPEELLTPEPKGTRASWSFDEGQGDRAADSSPGKLDLVLRGCRWVPGVRGTAIELNGTSDHVEIPKDIRLNFGEKSPLTLAGWLKTSATKGVLFSFRSEPDTFDLLNLFLENGKLMVWHRQRGNPFLPVALSTPAAVNDGKWHHFAAVRLAEGELRLYADGKSVAKTGGCSGKLVTNLRTLGGEARGIYLKDARVERTLYAGCLDELLISGDALSDAEVAKLATRHEQALNHCRLFPSTPDVSVALAASPFPPR